MLRVLRPIPLKSSFQLICFSHCNHCILRPDHNVPKAKCFGVELRSKAPEEHKRTTFYGADNRSRHPRDGHLTFSRDHLRLPWIDVTFPSKTVGWLMVSKAPHLRKTWQICGLRTSLRSSRRTWDIYWLLNLTILAVYGCCRAKLTTQCLPWIGYQLSKHVGGMLLAGPNLTRPTSFMITVLQHTLTIYRNHWKPPSRALGHSHLLFSPTDIVLKTSWQGFNMITRHVAKLCSAASSYWELDHISANERLGRRALVYWSPG